ncbi:hypothetical protein SAMN06296378_0788 [Salinibacterium xinjiangense]|uniref:Uncharacterized protein n=2 Tax=Salinibacterium xinjiangense TaxID=386302 RepID=A0A2C8Z4I6_9MICO|nr:hypothetical protein SAMN06296378_0788 [Salinibacterium xinjiangense]
MCRSRMLVPLVAGLAGATAAVVVVLDRQLRPGSMGIVAGVLLALGVPDGWLALPALGVPTLALLAGGLINPEQ